jgi:tetratricopeptide (TPR) repeat protein
VPLYTDIPDAAFVEAFRNAVESMWHVRQGPEEYRVRLDIEVLTPERLYCTGKPDCAPPAKGRKIDLEGHAARYPQNGAVLTTGASSLKILAGRALVLGPHDIKPSVFAHEFGHLLGFPDAYFRGYRDLGADGFQVLELVSDHADIMAAAGTGAVLPRHFEALIAARGVQNIMSAGLEALYERNDPLEAVARFREVLELNATHYGATLQLAKALDRAGQPQEALVWWRRILEMAEASLDAVTTKTAKERLAKVQ